MQVVGTWGKKQRQKKKITLAEKINVKDLHHKLPG